MTTQEVKSLVESFGLPYAYRQFDGETAVAPPFLCFFFGASDDFTADDCNYQPIRNLSLELYTDHKDFELEAMIESRLTQLSLPFEKEETFLTDQRMHMTSYEMEVVITTETEET